MFKCYTRLVYLLGDQGSKANKHFYPALIRSFDFKYNFLPSSNFRNAK